MSKTTPIDPSRTPSLGRRPAGRTGAPDVEALRRRMRGAVLVAGDARWDEARGAYNTRVDQHPDLLAIPEDADDVVAVVGFGRARSMQIVPQRTGHNAEPLGSLAGTILLRTDRMRDVTIDADRRRARVGAGAKWEDVVPRASELGLAALHGSTPDVSIAGYVMGGGVGWYGRKLGLAANSVTGFELVTADGRLRWVDEDHDPELFWALRGGGGNFGVVTSLEISLFDMPELYAGILFFPWERSAEVLHAWHAWTKTVPDETTSVGRMIQFPPTPDVPEALRGRSFAIVEAFHIGSEADGAEIMRPLRELEPVMDTFAMIPPVGLAEIHMDPPEPLPYVGDHAVLDGLSADAIDNLVAAVGPGSGSELASVEIRHLGGAMARAEATHGALAKMPGEYMMFGIGVAPDEPTGRAVRARLDAMLRAMSAHASGLYLNFTEHRVLPARLYPDETYRGLRAVKRAIDPDELFRANHAIPAGTRRHPARLRTSRPSSDAISNTLTMPVAADPDDTRRALRRLDLTAPANRALHASGLGDRVTVRPGGLTWRPDGGGHVDIDVDVRVEPGSEDGSFLSITTRFNATDERARTRLLDAWVVVGPLADHLAERAARAIKEYAEEDRFEEHDSIARAA